MIKGSQIICETRVYKIKISDPKGNGKTLLRTGTFVIIFRCKYYKYNFFNPS